MAEESIPNPTKQRKKRRPNRVPPEIAERTTEMIRLYFEGITAAEVGRRFGVSSQRVFQILAKQGIKGKLRPRTVQPYRRTPLTYRQWFWSQVDSSQGEDACWEWQGAKKSQSGYGAVTRKLLGRQQNYAHHVAYLFSRGKWAKLWVLHQCGNARCCNPSHLYEGTPKQNAADRERHRQERSNGWARSRRFSAETLMSIRRRRSLGEKGRYLARELGITENEISKIWHRRGHYADLPDHI